MEYQYKITNQESFELADIFECGQCFRWNIQDDESYTGVVKNSVINVSKKDNEIIFKGSFEGSKEEFENLIRYYFDLDTNYTDFKEKLANIDEYLNTAIKFGSGIRILNQDLWECIISFIISANNNIPRIKKIIERISERYGKEIKFQGKSYYTFPNVESLSKASVEDLRALGTGFRDVRIFNTTHMILEKKVDLNKIKEMKSSDEMREELLKLDGVGPKVADCILLFSTLKRLDVFPIDVWVRRVMNELYIHNENEEKVSKKEILNLADKKFLKISGLAPQYLFYWKRGASLGGNYLGI